MPFLSSRLHQAPTAPRVSITAFVLSALALCASTAHAAAGTEQYEYDALGRLTKVTYPSGQTLSYAYDAAGNRTATAQSNPGSGSGNTAETFVMTQGAFSAGTAYNSPPSLYGYYPGTIAGASLNPATLAAGKSVAWLVDTKRVGSFVQTMIKVSGFSADPSAAWLSQINCGGVARTGSTASYSYASGAGLWTWSAPTYPAMGFTGSGTVSCTLAHN